ncbi:alpha/beta hydrolase [soil metagenome]
MNTMIPIAALASLMIHTGPAAAQTAKPPIVLVHGAWETAAIWDGVAAGLKTDGYTVRVVTLPGRPGLPAAPNVVSMESYRAAIAEAVGTSGEPVVLVGHSFGGFPISVYAEANPARIRTLFYLAAYLPQDGQSLLSLATSDADSQAGPALQIDEAGGLATIAPAARAELFANGAPAEVGALVAASIVPEPLIPLTTPIRLSVRFQGVDKVYIHTARDHVVSPGLQTTMVAATPVRLEESLDTGHTPFVTDPAGVVAAIEAAIR